MKDQKFSIFSHRRAANLSRALGWPEWQPLRKARMIWMILPGDDAMSARLEIDGCNLTAEFIIQYLGKRVTAIRIRFDGESLVSTGILYQGNPMEAISGFRSHVDRMMSGPHIELLEAA